MNIKEEKQEVQAKPTDERVAPYDLLFITRAYNNKEITFEEWLRLTKEWAEVIIKWFGKET